MAEASRDLLTVMETARELGVTPRTVVQQRIARGHIRGVHVNARLWLVPRAEVERRRDRGRLRPGRRREPSPHEPRPGQGRLSALVARLDALREASRPLDVTVAELLTEAREERAVPAP